MELYNCVIEQEKSNSATGNSDIKNIILSGDDTYEALIMSGRDMTALGQEGMLYNLFELDNIDPYMDYWNPTLTESLTCGNKLYYAMGDLSATDNRAVRCLYFNKDLFELNKLENPYELVKSGKWTHERFFEMMNVGLADLNGDSIYDDNDRFGLFVQPTIGLNLFYSSGNQFVSKDSKDLFVTLFNTKKVLDTMTIVSDRIKNASEQIVMSNDYQKYIRLFAENHSLFYSEVSIFIEHFRQYEFNVGMLPMPKYDENQENYYQFADGYCLNFVGIPVTNKNPEKVALILEALSYESIQTLTPAYYEICLTGKAIRDEESKEMLDIIFNSYIVDYADLFKFNFFDDFSKALRGETEIASTLQSASESAKTLVDEINQ